MFAKVDIPVPWPLLCRKALRDARLQVGVLNVVHASLKRRELAGTRVARPLRHDSVRGQKAPHLRRVHVAQHQFHLKDTLRRLLAWWHVLADRYGGHADSTKLRRLLQRAYMIFHYVS